MITNNMMTPSAAVEYAFVVGEYLPSGVISAEMVAAAQSRYITPVIGEAMVEAINRGNYQTLLEEYIYPTLALFTRLEADMEGYPPTEVQRQRAQLFLANLSDHLNENQQEYKEYDAYNNVKNRCVMGGGMIFAN